MKSVSLSEVKPGEQSLEKRLSCMFQVVLLTVTSVSYSLMMGHDRGSVNFGGMNE